ncbi:DUF63 domain-containing protein [Halobacteriales archaeon SW_7_68_16]|nr:MAG: DUF63 domain-containing protein [Halobacteriales archaeon SW_7_68_16]
MPAGFDLPPLPVLGSLLAGIGSVAVALYRLDPPVTDRIVLAFLPWVVAGAALHVAALLGLVAPTVGRVAVVGVGVALPVIAHVLATGPGAGSIDPVPPAIALLGTAIVTPLTWTLLGRLRDDVTTVTGVIGIVLVFGHALDGVSTAVGVDLLGAGERTPFSRVILEVGAALPTADLIGAGWLFVLVKLVLASVVLVLLGPTLRETPRDGRLLVFAITALGLGPGVNNLLLFAVSAP